MPCPLFDRNNYRKNNYRDDNTTTTSGKMAPWTDQDKDSLIRIIAEYGDLGRPGDSSFGFVHGWSTVAEKFNGDKHENEDGFRSKHSMQ